jgi:hypothetical protein
MKTYGRLEEKAKMKHETSPRRRKKYVGSGSCVQAVHMVGKEDTFNKIKDANG